MTSLHFNQRKMNWSNLFVDTKRWNALITVSILLSAFWIYTSRVPIQVSPSAESASPQIGFAAPDFTLNTLDGKTVSLSSLRGKVVLINLWATWCPPCRAEMPALNNVYHQYSEMGFVVLGLNTTYQDSESDAASFVKTLGLSFPILLDRDGVISKRYQLQALPTSYFVGRDGIIRDVVLGGPMSEAIIATKIQSLLAEGKP
ncbi:MAG: TlpA disulfide reductase family protein [Chloroflexota bacterium]